MALTQESVFDLAVASGDNQGGWTYCTVWDRSGDSPRLVATLDGNAVSQMILFQYPDLSDSDWVEVVRRVAAGTCEMRFGLIYPGVSWEDLTHADWLIASTWPFRDSKIHLFYEHLTESGAYTEPADGAPAEFHFPGILRDQSLPVHYKRSDTGVERPAVRATTRAEALTALEADGWSTEIPVGPRRLRSLRGTLEGGSLVLEAPQNAYVRGNVEDRIHKIAVAFNDWFQTLDSGRRALPANRVAIEHWQACIGRLWEAKPFDRDIDIFYDGTRTTRTRRDKLDSEDWHCGDLELWVERGVQAFPLAINQSNRHQVLEATFDDFDFNHVKEDGTLGDLLYNGPDGKTQADWDRWKGDSYEAALRRGNPVLSAPAVAITVEQGATATAQVEPAGGVQPYEFFTTSAVDWYSVAEDGLVTASPDSTVAAQDHSLTVTVRDRVHGTVTVQVTVTVTAASGGTD